jgi:hypothetical protein
MQIKPLMLCGYKQWRAMRGSEKKLKTTALYDNLLRNGVQQSSRIKVLRATRQPGKIDSFCVCVCARLNIK